MSATAELILDYRRDEAVRLLALELVESVTGRPAYLSTDEEWAAAEQRAAIAIDATPKPSPPGELCAAVLLARGQRRFGTVEWVRAARLATAGLL